MIALLSRLFVKNRENVKDPTVRRAWGTLVSVSGILLNLLLFAAKFVVGTLSGSIAIRADALNNLSDAGSSAISLVSFKLSAKPADRHHPFGHARIEYIASMIVSFLILFVGVELVRSAIDKLLAPVASSFTLVSYIILGVSVALKLWMSYFNHTVGKKVDSDVMRATAIDYLADAGSTLAVLIAALLTGLMPENIAPYIDPVMGLLVAALIFFAGLRVLNETKNHLLGEAPDEATVENIRRIVSEYPEALGIHDLAVHSYGPGRTLASLHVEVDGKRDIFCTHDTIDLIERRLRYECGIECTIHLDPIAVGDPEVDAWRERICALALKLDERLRIHDFRMVPGTTHTNLIFDMEVPFELSEDDSSIKARLAEAIAAEAPNYFAVITVDRV